MSRFSWNRKPAPEMTQQATNPEAPHHILIEAVPVPRGCNEYDPEKVRVQSAALKDYRANGKDIFEANECKVTNQQGITLYQTQETYGTAMKY